MTEDKHGSFLDPDELQDFRDKLNERAECCAKCRYWKPFQTPAWYQSEIMAEDETPAIVEFDGICRRYPPHPGEGEESIFPETGWKDWCGEFFRDHKKLADPFGLEDW